MTLTDEELRKFGNTVQLIGGVWAGEGKVYLCLFPEEKDLTVQVDQSYPDNFQVRLREEAFTSPGEDPGPELEVLSMDSRDWERFLRQTDLMETDIIAKDKSGGLVKIVVRKSNRQIDQNVSWRVFKRDGYACRYCGRDDVPLTVDHLVRWEEGGPSVEANLLSACRKCNRTRGDQCYDDWLKSGYYERVSLGLAPGVHEDNVKVGETLDSIPRKVHVHSR